MFWKQKQQKRHFFGKSGSGIGSVFRKSPGGGSGSGGAWEKKLEAEVEAIFKKNCLEAKAEVFFFPLRWGSGSL